MPDRHVLIVNKEQEFIKVTTGFLEARQYKVDVAYTGEDALKKAQQYPDLILLGQMMPDMQGMEVCKRIRNDKRLNHISIIMISDDDDPLEKAKGFSVGADDYVNKAIDQEEFNARIEAVLRRNHVFRQAQEDKGELITELKHILAEEQITTYFQPIYAVPSLKAIGVEALSRPPTSGIIDNAEIMFKTALILNMYSDVEMACWHQALKKWKKCLGEKYLFLNCTPYFIESDHLSQEFLGDIKDNFKNIVLEITERTAIQDHKTFMVKLNKLRETGIKVAIDDVGSGFASLDMVVEVRPDIVKIDRHLIHEIPNDELKYNIVDGILTFCRKSNIMTIAEGIEKEEELEMVRELGADAAQGFLLAKPSVDLTLEKLSSIPDF